MPDGVFGYGSVLFCRLLDNGGEITTIAVFHENIENSSISVDVSVMVSYNLNVVVMKVLENVSMRSLLSVSGEDTGVNQDALFCYNLLLSKWILYARTSMKQS